jgi:hypothetical protein
MFNSFFLVELLSYLQTPKRLVIGFIRGYDHMFHMQKHRRLPEYHAHFYAAEINIAVFYFMMKASYIAVWSWITSCWTMKVISRCVKLFSGGQSFGCARTTYICSQFVSSAERFTKGKLQRKRKIWFFRHELETYYWIF